jgi:hypothetical protein
MASNCKQCKTALPRYDIGAIPEETLLSHCSHWLAQLESLKQYSTFEASKTLDDCPKLPLWSNLGLTSSGPGLSEIVGTTDKYIRALAVRGADSPQLASHIREFQDRQKIALAAIEGHHKAMPRKKFVLMGGFLAFAVFLFALIGVMVMSEQQSFSKETQRLEALVEKAEQSFANGDKSAARFIVGQIKWTATAGTPSKIEERVKVWDEKRQSLLEALRD